MRLLDKLFNRPPKPPRRLTVNAMLDRYNEFARTYYLRNGKLTSELHCIKSATMRMRSAYGDQPAKNFGPLALRATLQAMIDDGLARGTINDHLSRIKRIYRWAVAEELVDESVYNRLACVNGLRRGRTEARETSRVKPVPDEVVDATLPHLHPVIRAMVELQRYTAMRPGEVCIVRPCDVDRAEKPWQYRPEWHKTMSRDRERIIVIGPKGQGVLAPYLLRPADAHCFCPRDVEYHGGFRPSGSHYTKDSYSRHITRACKRHGIERWTPNQLRHLAATRVRREFGLEAAQVILGHAEADVTQIYAEKNQALADRVALAIG